MTLAIVITALAVFLCGASLGILAVLIAGIRSDDHAQNLTSAPATPGRLLLWLLRLALAPASTLAGFRAWVLAQCPVTPPPGRGSGPVPGKATKTGRFLDLVTERHGPLAHLLLHQVAAISAGLARTPIRAARRQGLGAKPAGWGLSTGRVRAAFGSSFGVALVMRGPAGRARKGIESSPC